MLLRCSEPHMAERLLRGAVWVSQLTGLGTGALGLCFWVLGSFMGSFSSRFPFAPGLVQG